MPRSLDPTVQSAFKLVKPKATQPVTKKVSHVVSSIKTKDYYACRSCLTKYSYHAGRMKEHLIGCKEYLTPQTTPNAITRIADARRPTNQTQIVVPTLSSTMKKALDLDAARVCYEEGLPFTLFEKPAMQRFLLCLNSAYKPELALDRCKTGRRSLADWNIPVHVVATLDGGPEDSGPPTACHRGVSVPVLFYI